MKKLFIGLPIYKDIEPECQNTIENIVFSQSNIFAMAKNGFCKMRGSPNIYYQRYNLAVEFLKTDADYFLYFDTDQMLDNPVADIELMIVDDKDIISPIITRRVFPHTPPIITLDRRKQWIENKSMAFFDDYRTFGNGPFEVYYCCGGIVLIKREVLEKIDKPFFPVIDNTGDLLSVDYSLYFKARQKGYKCWVEPRVKAGHIGKYIFTIDDYYSLLDSGDLSVTEQGGKYSYTLERG